MESGELKAIAAFLGAQQVVLAHSIRELSKRGLLNKADIAAAFRLLPLTLPADTSNPEAFVAVTNQLVKMLELPDSVDLTELIRVLH